MISVVYSRIPRRHLPPDGGGKCYCDISWHEDVITASCDNEGRHGTTFSGQFVRFADVCCINLTASRASLLRGCRAPRHTVVIIRGVSVSPDVGMPATVPPPPPPTCRRTCAHRTYHTDAATFTPHILAPLLPLGD